jgi:hypothetical protein|nr:hypothetical protein [Melioribacteraceae bacterium]
MKKIAIFLLLIITTLTFAQEDENVYKKYLDDNVLDFIYKSRPMIEISYGYGLPVNKNVENELFYASQMAIGSGANALGKFANIGNWDVKLGKSEQKFFNGILVDLNERYVFGSYLSNSTQTISETDYKILTDTYRFGFGSRDGIGIGGSGFSVVPYVSQDFVWTKLSDYDLQLPLEGGVFNQSPELNDYLGTFRFGDKSSYGMKVELASMLQLNAGYETSVVYRRHLFWYWSGSYLLSQIGYNTLGYFTDEIVDSSPVLGSIFNFALKAGYHYGYYLLRQENMNWPFNTSGNEAPLTYETFNVGFTFLF